jgi:hypothetical protein
MNPKKITEEEVAFIDAFVQKVRRERLRCLVVNSRRHKVFIQELAHFKWLDQHCVRTLASNAQNPQAIANILRLKGAPDMCFVISEDSKLHGKQLSLLTALEEVVGYGMGTFISCIPGKLGYFEDEDHRCLLEN